jgi:hypothetical protein
MIYCGSGSDFGKDSIQFRIQTIFSSVIHQQKICPKSAIVMQPCFPDSWPLIFDFLTFVFHFMLDPDQSPFHRKAFRFRNAKSCGTGSTTPPKATNTILPDPKSPLGSAVLFSIQGVQFFQTVSMSDIVYFRCSSFRRVAASVRFNKQHAAGSWS